MELRVPTHWVETPLRQAVGDIRGQLVDRPLEPIGGDLAKLPVEVDTDAIQIDAENELGLARTIGRLDVGVVLHGPHVVRRQSRMIPAGGPVRTPGAGVATAI